MRPQVESERSTHATAVAVPAALIDVSLIDAPTCAATGGMSVSWWFNEVKEGRAPQAAIKKTRCTRWTLASVRAFWIKFAQQAAEDAPAAARVKAQAKKASAAAKAKRAAAASAKAQE